MLAFLAILLVILGALEFRTSWIQAHILSHIAQRMTFHLVDGKGSVPVLSAPGPYDIRLGHAQLPRAIESLERAGYVQTSHAELSNYTQRAVKFGLPPIYREKIQAGLRLEDGQGVTLYEASVPRELYSNYGAIAPLVVQTLLFAENRQILEESLPYRNPTIEWERLFRAVLDFGMNKVNPGHPVTGASTVATQLEKLRHSPGGRTFTSGDKFRQMVASSLRAYQNGPENLTARKQIVSDYINSLPLAATPSQGEIIGLADGLRAWFGADPNEVNQILLLSDDAAQAAGKFEARARAYRQAVTLLLAAKRPSGYLIDNRDALTRRVDTYLILLGREKIISTPLRDAALAVRPVYRDISREKPREILHEIPTPDVPAPGTNMPVSLTEKSGGIEKLAGAEKSVALSDSDPADAEKTTAEKSSTVSNAIASDVTGPGSAVAQHTLAERKGIDAIRTSLLSLTGAESLYALDRFDLTASTTLDRTATTSVARTLQSLSKPDAAADAGLFGARMLKPEDLDGIIYSFTLYERDSLSRPNFAANSKSAEQGAGQQIANVLRIQADNYPQPLNINQGTKLELGSTAKLRTLASYLEIVAQLHAQLSSWTAGELENIPRQGDSTGNPDALTAWAAQYLISAPDRSLAPMLDAAMLRSYSANPRETFFTGGGVHTFANFDPPDNGRILTVREALQHSVNLVFIRLMRDIVRYHLNQHPETLAVLNSDVRNPLRHKYLMHFADYEGRQFLDQFYRKYSPHPEHALETILTDSSRPTSNNGVATKISPRRFAVIYRTIHPEYSFDTFESAALAHSVEFHARSAKAIAEDPDNGAAQRLYAEFAPDPLAATNPVPSPEKFNWNDLGYLARVHPLELWTAAYLTRHPAAKFEEIMRESAAARQESYSWLFRPTLRREQNTRIYIMLEREAFDDIHASWARLGFPFSELVPSLATAIGSSGDTPDALATLAGIILNDGIRYPSVRIPKLHFAQGTPFETTFERDLSSKDGSNGQRVMPAEVAALMHKEMIGVVEHGTAGRANGAVTLSDGRVIPIGGKTGTGDNRIQHYAANGSVIESTVRNRTAAFVFTIGDRFFGTLVVYADGPSAASKTFTSALAVQVFRNLAPQLRPLIERAQ